MKCVRKSEKTERMQGKKGRRNMRRKRTAPKFKKGDPGLLCPDCNVYFLNWNKWFKHMKTGYCPDVRSARSKSPVRGKKRVARPRASGKVVLRRTMSTRLKKIRDRKAKIHCTQCCGSN